MANMTPADRFGLITENLQEVLNKELIENILAEGRNPKIYWGMDVRLCDRSKLTVQERRLLANLTADTLVSSPADKRLHPLTNYSPRHQNRPVPSRRRGRGHPGRRYPCDAGLAEIHH